MDNTMTEAIKRRARCLEGLDDHLNMLTLVARMEPHWSTGAIEHWRKAMLEAQTNAHAIGATEREIARATLAGRRG